MSRKLHGRNRKEHKGKGDTGRLGILGGHKEIQETTGRLQGDTGRHRETQGDTGRHRETQGTE